MALFLVGAAVFCFGVLVGASLVLTTLKTKSSPNHTTN